MNKCAKSFPPDCVQLYHSLVGKMCLSVCNCNFKEFVSIKKKDVENDEEVNIVSSRYDMFCYSRG
jgi:hypothetical protein